MDSRLKLAVLALALFPIGCATGMGQIKKPQAFTDPDMDFRKISVAIILPMFPENTEDQRFSGAFGQHLEAALSTSQRQWRLIGSREALQIINAKGLGSGYKNLQADYNTPSSWMMNQVVFSPGTNQFIRDLQRETGANGFIVGTYHIGESPVPGGIVGRLLIPGAMLMPGAETRVKVSLLYSNGTSPQNWWSGTVSRRRITDQSLADMAASIAAYLGKGTLNQL